MATLDSKGVGITFLLYTENQRNENLVSNTNCHSEILRKIAAKLLNKGNVLELRVALGVYNYVDI